MMEPLLVAAGSHHRTGLIDLAIDLAGRSAGLRRSQLAFPASLAPPLDAGAVSCRVTRAGERAGHSRSRIATIGWTKFGPWSQGNRIQVSWLTSVT